MSSRPKVFISGDTGFPAWAMLLVRRSIRTALAAEGVRIPCEVSVLFTDDAGIQAINREQRNIDSPTDVLSFPAFDFTPGSFRPQDGETDPETGRMPLGDMALNLDRIRSQGEEYGHGPKRETAYLTVHSVLHLLGYDHLDEGPKKKQMRQREEEIMRLIRL